MVLYKHGLFRRKKKREDAEINSTELEYGGAEVFDAAPPGLVCHHVRRTCGSSLTCLKPCVYDVRDTFKNALRNPFGVVSG
jgi:hypothetical protein